MADCRFPRSRRLRKQNEFANVYQSDSFAADDSLVVRGTYNGLPVTRIGISVSKRVGNAVVRNRWKRVIHEAFRKQQHQLPEGLDIVVRPRKDAVCDYPNVYQSLGKTVMRLQKKLEKSRRVNP